MISNLDITNICGGFLKTDVKKLTNTLKTPNSENINTNKDILSISNIINFF